MSRDQPLSDCADVLFEESHVFDDTAQVALEDYARVLVHASRADLIFAGDEVLGVHVCGLTASMRSEAAQDIEDFASQLLRRGEGLGWS